MKTKETEEMKIETGDIISKGLFGKEELFFVYDVIDDGLQAMPLTSEAGSVMIGCEDLVEGTLPSDYFLLDRMLFLENNAVIRKEARLGVEKIDEILRKIAHRLVEKHYVSVHRKKEDFIPGKTYVRYSGRVYDAEEIKALVDSSLDFWLTAGRFAKRFEKDFTRFLGVKHCLLTNSGSSANLLAVSALTSPKLGERRLLPGDEIITTACAFPTTVNPIIQNNLVPVFLDVDVGTYNIQASRIEEAISEKTGAIMLAHTMGNPFDLDRVMSIAREHDLWVIEDNCDALGSKYNRRYTGTYGHLATFSFYPAHHITMGEGGAVATDDSELKRLVESFRDWGRECWCHPGCDNTCGKRFGWEMGDLPFGYDHKYIYSHIGYNLKLTDMQAAVGTAQLKKLDNFIQARKKNWRLLYDGLKKYEEHFILPKTMDKADASWFGFLLTIKENAPFSRNEIVSYLEENNIATRLLFSGNIIRHPGFKDIPHRVHDNLRNTDFIMDNTFWVGVYPGLTREMIDYMLAKLGEFLAGVHEMMIDEVLQ